MSTSSGVDDQDVQKYITMIQEIPSDLRSWDMEALLEARLLDEEQLKHYRSHGDTKVETPALTADALAEDLCVEDDALDQRLINFARIAFLGSEPSIIFQPHFIKDLYPFFTVKPSSLGYQVACTFFSDAIKEVPWTTRLVLKAIMSCMVFATQQNANMPAIIKMLEIAYKAVSKDPESHTATLSEFSPTLIADELMFVIARYQYRIHTVMERHNEEANRTVVQGLEKAGHAMIKHQPERPDGYFISGLSRFEQLDAQGACEQWRTGLKKGDALDHRYFRCVLKYELAWGIISGGEGSSFIYRTVHNLYKDASEEAKQLKWYTKSEKNELFQVQHAVQTSIDTAIPPGTRLNDRLGAAALSRPSDANRAARQQQHQQRRNQPVDPTMVCAFCGTVGNKAMNRCAGCKEARYCSKECQLKAWPLHKADCKAIQAQLKEAK